MSIPPRILAIIEETANDHGLTVKAMLSQSARHVLARARFDCWTRIRSRILINGNPPSLPQIGLWFGGRDHTTIIHGLKRFKDGDCYPPGMSDTKALEMAA